MRALAAVVAGLLAIDSGAAADPGRAIFEGQPGAAGAALIGSARVPIQKFACRNCHRRDGEGGGEGDAPPITWQALTQPTEERPAYDTRAFARALSTGKAPGGRDLSRLMPRYDLDEEVVAKLIAHLTRLPAEQRAGVLPDRIVLAVPVQAGDLRLAKALEAAIVARQPPNGTHGRRIVLQMLSGDMPEILASVRSEATAVLSPVHGTAEFTAAGIPVLFPLAAISEADDPELVRSLYATREQLHAALAERARTDGCSLDDGATDCALIADGGGAVVGDWADTTRLYLTVESAHALGPAIVGIGGTLVIARHEAATLTRAAATEQEPLDVHAALVAEILLDALTVAGRDLTRTALMEAIGQVARPDLGLSFRPGAPSGSDAVAIYVVNPKEDR